MGRSGRAHRDDHRHRGWPGRQHRRPSDRQCRGPARVRLARRVAWTDRAKARPGQIHHYIAQDKPIDAERVIDRLTRRVAQLAEHPRSGRVVEKYHREDLRELIDAPYRIVYLILADRIDILTVRDSRRVLPRRLADL
ncbi:type II toxin-antitoxin system RelE/ParE family toxin [Coralloluteibacterium stylophorae]|uniref:Type II toxin-antitoxin system RelE/ParE family toxin n=1 Tax=Coralloluteibacterium stylophorae TaxID=1776034 RepID=A0A8J7VVZ7_9GAMM|nr:type II toxin-antitoxin system RelE/ParE family toxin [Coralloluteibacterium stylophorae]